LGLEEENVEEGEEDSSGERDFEARGFDTKLADWTTEEKQDELGEHPIVVDGEPTPTSNYTPECYDVAVDRRRTIILEPKSKSHKHTLIWLQGSGLKLPRVRDIFKDKRALRLPEGTRIIMLAPQPISTHEEGQKVYWYGVKNYHTPHSEVIDGKIFDVRYFQYHIEQSIDYVTRILKREINALGGDASKVFLGGYNRGACIALATYLKLETSLGSLGGIFASGGVFCADLDWDKIDISLKKKTPILHYHSFEDMRVPMSYSKRCY
jgi:predicted esterase